MKRLKPPECFHCTRDAKLVTGKRIYPHLPNLWHKWYWICEPCEAWVGCHPNTKNALGQPSNSALRRAKIEAHAAFDPIWLEGTVKRSEAYAWLAGALGIPRHKCHIGYFSEELCARVVELCRTRKEAGSDIGVQAAV